MPNRVPEGEPFVDLLRVAEITGEENPVILARSFGYTIVKSAILTSVLASAAELRDSLSLMLDTDERKTIGNAIRTRTHYGVEYTGFEMTEMSPAQSPKKTEHPDVTIAGDYTVIGLDGLPMTAQELKPGDIVELQKIGQNTTDHIEKGIVQITLVSPEVEVPKAS